MALFLLLSEEIQFLSTGFNFLSMSKFSRVRFRLFVAWSIQSCFSSHFCFLGNFVLLILVMFVLFLGAVISLRAFLCSVLVVVLIHWRYLGCWWVLFLFLFLAHIVSLRHLCDVSPYLLSWVFLFSGSFDEVLLTLTLRIGPECLKRGQSRYLSLQTFHSRISWWSFTGVWETACILKSPGLMSVFWLILIDVLMVRIRPPISDSSSSFLSHRI